jgi:hypothetical protein
MYYLLPKVAVQPLVLCVVFDILFFMDLPCISLNFWVECPKKEFNMHAHFIS